MWKLKIQILKGIYYSPYFLRRRVFEFFSKIYFFQEVLWLSVKSSKVQIFLNENLWLKLQLVFSCTQWVLAASPVNIFYFYLIKMKNLIHSKLFLAFICPLKVLKTFLICFNHQIKSKTSLYCNMTLIHFFYLPSPYTSLC